MAELRDPTERSRLYAAVLARDYRFDGSFFVGVTTTGIYCRPICPARPREENCRFFSSSLDAERAGFRPCLRCRPESAPLSPAWYGTSAIVGRAIRYIEDFGLGEGDAETFAARFGVGARQLRRLFLAEIGTTPRRLYEDRRLDLARTMLVETTLPITDIAFASGYRSIRRFNAAFRERFARSPSELRSAGEPRKAGPAGRRTPATRGGAAAEAKPALPETAEAGRPPALVLRLSYRPPYDWEGMLAYLERHAIPGVEEVSGAAYIRHFRTSGGVASVRVEADPARPALVASFDAFDRAGLMSTVRGLRRLFDLDADPLLVSTAFERSPLLARLDEKRPGMRAPGAFDPFETAVAIILSQLVSTARARSLVGALVAAYGEVFEAGGSTRRLFPRPATLAASTLSALPTTEARREAIRALAAAVEGGGLSLHPHQDVAEAKRKLLALPGIGAWTAEYIAMRCLSDPDSYPATDLVLARIGRELGEELRLEELRPWRSYAVYRLLREYGSPPPARPGSGEERSA